MDLEETTNANDTSSFASEPSQSLALHTPGTIIQSPDTRSIEFTPSVNPGNLHKGDFKNHQPKPRKKRLLIIFVMCCMYRWLCCMYRWLCCYENDHIPVTMSCVLHAWACVNATHALVWCVCASARACV